MEEHSLSEAAHIVGGLRAFQNVSTKFAETAPLMPPLNQIAPNTEQTTPEKSVQFTDFTKKIW